MQKTIRFLHSRTAAVVFGAISMAFVSGKLLLFNGSVLNILPWGILALAVSVTAPNKPQAVKLGGVFGFVVSFSFLWFNNTDPKTLASSVTLTVLAGAAALFGLVSGVALGWLGWQVRQFYNNKTS